ncbi:hypothetical protein SYNPS1DRAFT_22955 [Syncephalis pseudoplumigaleata]|uniref:Uncharacterized protein n=1 Tax=Syncephalis pseudoplumigaleata TaxID=1712513 RepID=A0A4P9YY43_9FUNG|nr:hypothetical protein SYNPS1DRAFT_22955 [Syncephalis pseudoplumigaleata]|eukprot:RKP25016.1 hypothetical protein SYNPS1DRAFT_22955 [Syncephalis pseudoplumigaleata]
MTSTPTTPTAADESTSGRTTPTAPELPPRTVRALYSFNGHSEYHELTFEEGELLTVVRERVADGWWVCEKDGVQGLVPESYITYGADFEFQPRSPSPTHSVSPSTMSTGTGTTASIMGMSRSATSTSTSSSIPPSVRNQLLVKRQLNRFSRFVTSGVEEFILYGGRRNPPPTSNMAALQHIHEEDDGNGGSAYGDGANGNGQPSESDKHYIENGPAWRHKAPEFRVRVHDPEKRAKMAGMQEYTIYQVTSEFAQGVSVTVERRFSQFQWLHRLLELKFSALILPSLPEKQFSGRFNEEFIERRRRALERFINRLARHPVVRYSDLLTHFLSCTDESEWRREEKRFEADRVMGHTFFQHVYHPEFNVDDDGDVETLERFHAHARAIDRYLPSVIEAGQGYRDVCAEARNQYQRLGLGILRLITGTEAEGYEPVNDEGVWCWRDGCTECLCLTKSLQSAAELMQETCDLREQHIQQRLTPWLEHIRAYSGTSIAQAPLVEMHIGAHRKYQEVLGEGFAEDGTLERPEDFDAEDIKSRCETVYNVTLAEVDRYHDEKTRDFRDFAMLEKLREARALFDEPTYSQQAETPRQPTRLAKELEELPSTRPASVASVTSVVGGVVDGVGSVGSFLKSKARGSYVGGSMFSDWGWGARRTSAG